MAANLGGARFRFEKILNGEMASMKGTKWGMVVCGPSPFCDDVRAAAVTVDRIGKVDMELVEESPNWEVRQSGGIGPSLNSASKPA